MESNPRDLAIVLLRLMTSTIESGQSVDLHDALNLSSILLELTESRGVLMGHNGMHRFIQYIGDIDYITAGGLLDAYKTYNDLKLCAAFTAEDTAEHIEKALKDSEAKVMTQEALGKLAISKRAMRNPLDVLRESGDE